MAVEFAHHIWCGGYRFAGAAAGAVRRHTATNATIPTRSHYRRNYHRPQSDAATRHPFGQRHADHYTVPHPHSHYHLAAAGGVWRCACWLDSHDGTCGREHHDAGYPLRNIRSGHHSRQLPAPGYAAAGSDHLPAASAAHTPALWPTDFLDTICGTVGRYHVLAGAAIWHNSVCHYQCQLPEQQRSTGGAGYLFAAIAHHGDADATAHRTAVRHSLATNQHTSTADQHGRTSNRYAYSANGDAIGHCHQHCHGRSTHQHPQPDATATHTNRHGYGRAPHRYTHQPAPNGHTHAAPTHRHPHPTATNRHAPTPDGHPTPANRYACSANRYPHAMSIC